MLKIEKISLSPRANLTYAKTDKFKTGCISVNLIVPLARESAAINALLPNVLRRGSALHPDMESISELTDELYGARIEPIIRKKGELQCIGFFADFIDDDFVPAGDRILERVAELLGELLLQPKMRTGLLLTDYVESERSNLIDQIRAGVNDKRVYASNALLKNMCSEEPFGVNRLGEEDEALAITAQTLTKHYRHVLETARIEVLYCGHAETERVEFAVRDMLSGFPGFGQKPEIFTTDIVLEPPEKNTREFREQLDVAQGKLALGFRMGRTMLEPDYPALSVFNAAFGGSVTSKLFLNVRERLSLCYYASSVVERHKGVMVVSSGVEFESFQKARDEILSQLDAIRKGDLSDWEFVSAKRAVMTAQLTALDRPSGLEESCFDLRIAGIPYSPDELATLADVVDREKIVEIANSVRLDSVYYLEGKGAL
ncbi:MAG: insulinase family protein [Clostridiales bacterium]|nr:insulinase family protein [Clostridiales bacterium]